MTLERGASEVRAGYRTTAFRRIKPQGYKTGCFTGAAPPGCKFIYNYDSSPATCLLFDISRAAGVLLAVTDIAVADKSGVVLLLPQPPVDELLHQRRRQRKRENVDENDGLHAQNLPHLWVRASNPAPENKPRALRG